MHKDVPVAQVFEMDGQIHELMAVYNEDHLPVGVSKDYPASISAWHNTRQIPGSRQDMDIISASLNHSLKKTLKTAHNVSLIDCYWTKDENEDLRWEDVRFSPSNFLEGLRDIFIYGAAKEVLNVRTPDITTDGLLSKAWFMREDVPYLCKRGALGLFANGRNLLCANEVVVSKIAESIGIETVGYNYYVLPTDEPVCKCPSFIKDQKSEEFVSAYQISRQFDVTGKDLFDWFCDNRMRKEVEDMVYLISLTGNIDCHMKNFGIIRNPDTLGIIKFCPLFDLGSSLGFNGLSSYTKPFAESRDEQLKLLSSLRELPDKEYVYDMIECYYTLFNVKDLTHLAKDEYNAGLSDVTTRFGQIGG